MLRLKTLMVPNGFARPSPGNPWRTMIAVNAAVMIGVFIYKITREPYVPYIHLLVDYHFGFTKRALIGATMGLFFSKVPVWLVFALSGAVWLITLGLFVALFRKTFGLDDEHLPLFVLTAGSPFFFKNFMHTLGHFDIYGCTFAIGLLLIPARSVAYLILAAALSMILILIHHIHLLMYVPTIAVIVVLRYYLVQGVTGRNAMLGAAAVMSVGVLFLAAQFYGSMAVPKEEFVRYLEGRMADPAKAYLLTFPYIWYQSLGDEIRAGVRALDCASCSAVELFPRPDPLAFNPQPPAHCRRRHRSGESWVSDHLCHGVRLFAVDFELGGLHVPDPARGEDAARLARRAGGGR
jgi:hypothetical protein